MIAAHSTISRLNQSHFTVKTQSQVSGQASAGASAIKMTQVKAPISGSMMQSKSKKMSHNPSRVNYSYGKVGSLGSGSVRMMALRGSESGATTRSYQATAACSMGLSSRDHLAGGSSSRH